jgi:hypothetical protein
LSASKRGANEDGLELLHRLQLLALAQQDPLKFDRRQHDFEEAGLGSLPSTAIAPLGTPDLIHLIEATHAKHGDWGRLQSNSIEDALHGSEVGPGLVGSRAVRFGNANDDDRAKAHLFFRSVDHVELVADVDDSHAIVFIIDLAVVGEAIVEGLEQVALLLELIGQLLVRLRQAAADDQQAGDERGGSRVLDLSEVLLELLELLREVHVQRLLLWSHARWPEKRERHSTRGRGTGTHN